MNQQASVSLLCSACDLLVEEHRGRFAADTFKRTVASLLQQKNWSMAVKYQTHLIHDVTTEMSYTTERFRACLVLIVILLVSGDEVEAGKCYGHHVE